MGTTNDFIGFFFVQLGRFVNVTVRTAPAGYPHSQEFLPWSHATKLFGEFGDHFVPQLHVRVWEVL
jgi:hypothetical protein